MSTFAPTQWTLEPADQPDALSGAVMQTLSRPVTRVRAWGPVMTFVLGILSFGILPLIYWPMRFANFVVGEQRQYWHLLEWLRIRSGDAQAQQLQTNLHDGGAAPTLKIIPMVMLLVIALNFVPWLAKPWVHRHEVLLTTYRYDPSGLHTYDSNWARVPNVPSQLYRVWIVCLCFAYVSHWLHVRQHVADMQVLVRRINDVLVRNGVSPVPVFRNSLGFGPLWLAAAVAGAAVGAWWMIPAAFAGAVQRRYVMRTSIQTRQQLAQRVRGMLLDQRPQMNVATPHSLRKVCGVSLCGKAIPDGAAFCPRCGTRVAPSAPVA